MAFTHLIVQRDGPVETVTLNRPDVRNAFNDTVIAELTAWADGVRAAAGLRAAIIQGAGSVFCAGADLGWMRRMIAYSRDENVRDAGAMARMFTALDTLPIPLIGRVQGAALGGGCGLAAVCDIVVAADEAVFGFTEVKLGIVPAVISPYVLAKIGRSAARELFLTGERFPAVRAREIGLVHAVVSVEALDIAVRAYVGQVLGSGPDAVAAAKALIRQVWADTPETAATRTAEVIADRRASAEGQEGMRAFMEKRRAAWREDR